MLPGVRQWLWIHSSFPPLNSGERNEQDQQDQERDASHNICDRIQDLIQHCIWPQSLFVGHCQQHSIGAVQIQVSAERWKDTVMYKCFSLHPATIISVTCFMIPHNQFASPIAQVHVLSGYCFIISVPWYCPSINSRIISPLATPPTFLVSAFRMFTGSSEG